jgi:hypothetical protein
MNPLITQLVDVVLVGRRRMESQPTRTRDRRTVGVSGVTRRRPARPGRPRVATGGAC